ncbi:hypothetical protein [Mesorhizobium sp.]|uniref:hypothetical protein n=1 Tax=Mesorhizobium sp. TaxID=1871066 RepID=UPI000FE6D590|nr:hypothetical protein [Mesorhizobium sp.]RWP09994.1 MAG: hypothetical protein EOQ97_14850 [Mesorhizobium sp.]TIU38895.1 MAG: hypothetical protein E5W26_16015 [Mesorhizobium sp.]
MLLQKDEVLNGLATVGNVAQFVALRPNAGMLEQSYSRIAGHSPNHRFATVNESLAELIARSGEGKLNVRSYRPHDPRSREFVYGLELLDDVLAHANRLAADGLHLIVNETIDVHDGGVSGVLQGDTVEFAPDDTPRCVEKPGVASLPFLQAIDVLSTVYGFKPELRAASGERTEFSIHPIKRGWQQAHTLLWEHETNVPGATTAAQRWPNHFSRFLGDKTFGLLVAQTLGMQVPRTVVVNRRVAPFVFGTPTGSAEVWTRTCPVEPHPGLYTTVKGWTDPFALLASEDPEGKIVASVLRQDAVPAGHSGAAIVDADGNLIIEGRSGEGDRLMLGIELPEMLPTNVTDGVRSVYRKLRDTLGPVKFEWVHDGARVWVIQLHRGATSSSATTIVPGDAHTWAEFKVEDGLDRLRVLLEQLPPNAGVSVIGEIGLTSHIADVLRRAGLPARLPAR